MNSQRLAFALTQIKGEQWARFERFASEFLASDYPGIRTVASPSGDLGRDAELFSPTGDVSVMLQYSVQDDFSTKIRKTAKRISEAFPKTSVLVYVTSQEIGAKADKLKKEIRENYKIALDICDRLWFLDRCNLSAEREKLAEQLVAEIAEPLLVEGGLIKSKTSALSSSEAMTAVFHLQMQWEDDSRDKGLTKMGYEALVKTVLSGTDANHLADRNSIDQEVKALLEGHPPEVVGVQIDSAIQRLTRKGEIKFWPAKDSFCLSHQESEKVADRLAEKGVNEARLRHEIGAAVLGYFELLPSVEQLQILLERVRRVLDKLLMSKSQEFASAVSEGRAFRVEDDQLSIILNIDFSENPEDTGMGADAIEAVRSATREILHRSTVPTQKYLRRITDGYTLFGFMRCMPDVQKVMKKVFSSGTIWLDSSVILPAMAESLAAYESRIVSRLLHAARDAGIELRVTDGISEEVERHVNRCRIYSRTPRGQWSGGVPFLYAMYALQAGNNNDFSSWANNFCGERRPLDDIKEYLTDEWGISVENLTAYVERSEDTFRWSVEEVWRKAHEKRRKNSTVETEDHVVDKLIAHDVECYLGLIEKRAESPGGELGYNHWWLTFDRTVREFERELSSTWGREMPPAPVMSPDFLSEYLVFGPSRSRLSKDVERSIPVTYLDAVSDHIPEELLQIAEELRNEYGADSDRIIRRKLRDTLDLLRRKRGTLAKGGFSVVREELERSLRSRTN